MGSSLPVLLLSPSPPPLPSGHARTALPWSTPCLTTSPPMSPWPSRWKSCWQVSAPRWRPLRSVWREITCEECFDGLKKGVEQLLQEETIAAIVEALSGDAFCAQSEDAERCAAAIQTLIPLALPALTANPDEEAGMMVCNGAIPDICS